MKFSQWIGISAVLVLVGSSFMNWAWYPDLHQYFTGFYSENNAYGKPGKVFIVFGIFSIIFFLVPRVWAKRWNLFVCAMVLAWAIRCFIVFTICYHSFCPERQAGIWIMMVSATLIMAAALFPDTAVRNKKQGSPE